MPTFILPLSYIFNIKYQINCLGLKLLLGINIIAYLTKKKQILRLVF